MYYKSYYNMVTLKETMLYTVYEAIQRRQLAKKIEITLNMYSAH